MRAGERMKVSRAPDIDAPRVGAKQAEIPVREMALGAGARGALELRRPRPLTCDLAHQPMRRLIEIVWHLHRQRPARAEFRHQRREQRLVVRNPLQNSVREDHVERLLRTPFANVGDLEGEVWKPLARSLDHVRGRIEADNVRLRVPPPQDFGRIARAAANVCSADDLGIRDSRHEIMDRPSALLFEFDVLGGGPGHCERSFEGEPPSCDAGPDGASIRRPCLRRAWAPNLRA